VLWHRDIPSGYFRKDPGFQVPTRADSRSKRKEGKRREKRKEKKKKKVKVKNNSSAIHSPP